jgi:hypothetical protein
MQGIGIVIVALGIIGFIWGVMQKLKAGRVADAPLASTGDVVQKGSAVAGPKGQISAQGNVTCQQPLISPVTGTPCLYYSIKTTAAWKEGQNEKTKIIDEQKVAAQFAIDDGTGPVWIDAREGGDFEPSKLKTETKGAGLLGGITGADIMFGSYRVQTGMLSLGTKYTVEEHVMPVVPRLYACGKIADQGGAIGSPSWRQLILSPKSRDELLASATKGAKIFLAAGAAAFLVGSGLAIVGQLMHKEEPLAPAAVAAKEAPPPALTTASPTAEPAPTTAPTTTPTPVGTTKTTSASTKGSAAPAKSGAAAAKPDGGAPKKK